MTNQALASFIDHGTGISMHGIRIDRAPVGGSELIFTTVRIDNGARITTEHMITVPNGNAFLAPVIEWLRAGQPEDEAVRLAAHAEAHRRYTGDIDAETGERMDDWGYAEVARDAFIAGAAYGAQMAKVGA